MPPPVIVHKLLDRENKLQIYTLEVPIHEQLVNERNVFLLLIMNYS